MSMLILTEYIRRHELTPLQPYLDLQDILIGAQKVLKGLAIPTKPPRPRPGFRFYKVRLGRRQSARMIVFLRAENQKIVPLIIRLKKDQIFGSNMAMNNSRLVNELNKNLDWVLADLTAKRYQEFPL